MNRSTQRKLSRALVGGLALTLALGGVFWLGKIVGSNSTSSAQARAERGETNEAVLAQSAAAAAAASPTTKPLSSSSSLASSSSDPFEGKLAQANVLQTPTSPVASAAATTQPSPAAPPMLAAGTPTQPDSASASASAPQKSNVQLAVANTGRVAEQQDLVVGNPIADAKSKIEHGKLLDARRILNSAITDRLLADADVKTAKQMLNEINAVVVFSTKQFKDDEFGGTFEVPSGGVLEKIARSHEVNYELLMRINAISKPQNLRAGQNLKIIRGPFNAVVDKRDYSLELWIGEPGAKGAMYVTSLPVGLGEDDSTPTGVWAVKNRVPNPAYFSPRGEGIIPADDPKNPLGEHWIGLTGTEGAAVGKQSYGIHGTIEPDSIGKQASMGCIRLKNEDVARVYEALVQDKSTVTVRE